MPVSPEYAADLTKPLLAIFTDAEETLLETIGHRLSRGIDLPNWIETNLIQVQRMRSDTISLIRKLEREGYDAISEAVWKAYNRGAGMAGNDLRDLGKARAIAFTSVNTRAVVALVDEAKQQLGSTFLRIQSSAESIFRDVVQQSAGRALTGIYTRRQVAAHSMSLWADRGITGFTDKAGHNWSLSSYAEMTSRTATGQAMISGHIDRLASSDNDLVMVSDAPEECSMCRKWEGKVLSISGSDLKRPTIGEARDAGLFHANCRHRLVAYIPGLTNPLHDTADPEGDILRQRQRAYERRIRQLKRRQAAMKDLDAAAARAEGVKLRAKQIEFKQWREANHRKNLAYRTT